MIPPTLIYQGESGDLQDTWIEDWTPETPAYFGVSKNSWSCDLFGLQWLDIFHRHTKHKAGNRRRLLRRIPDLTPNPAQRRILQNRLSSFNNE